MLTDKQTKDIIVKLRQYRRKYLQQKFADLDESGTRIIVNSLLCDVLGYEELIDVKTEYRIRELYADYIIMTKGKTNFIVEVKAKKLRLNKKHMRQSMEYGVNEGIDWVLLTNGQEVELYRIMFERPVRSELFFKHDLSDYSSFKQAGCCLWATGRILGSPCRAVLSETGQTSRQRTVLKAASAGTQKENRPLLQGSRTQFGYAKFNQDN